jgi:hypothetical protein
MHGSAPFRLKTGGKNDEIRSKAALGGVAQHVLGIGLHGCDPTARAGQARHLGRHQRGLRHRDQQGTGVHHIERAGRQPGTRSICHDNLDIAEAAPGHELRGHGHVRRIGIHPNHSPL